MIHCGIEWMNGDFVSRQDNSFVSVQSCEVARRSHGDDWKSKTRSSSVHTHCFVWALDFSMAANKGSCRANDK
jgi:hypothetical protein